MSAIVCIKDGGTLALGTDSRRMNGDYSAVDSDAVEKIIELGKRTFLAQMGRKLVTDLEAEKARDLAWFLTDIRALAKALDGELRPALRQLIDILSGLSHPEIRAALSGDLPIHRFVLTGYSGDELGWVCHNFRIRDGEIEVTEQEYFDTGRKIYVTDGGRLRHLTRDPATWSDDPIAVTQTFLAEARRLDPCVGGPDQVVVIDGRGARWIRRLTAHTVTADTVAASAIRASDFVFETGAIQTADIGNLQVTEAKIANLAVTAAKIANATITEAKIADLAVTGAKIADATITNAKIADATIESAKIVSLEVSKLAAGDFTGRKLTLNLNGLTTTISNEDSGGAYYGLLVSDNTDPDARVGISYNGIDLFNSAGTCCGQFVVSGSASHLRTDEVNFSGSTASSANAGAASLPANPVGFIVVQVAGTNRKIPYYAT